MVRSEIIGINGMLCYAMQCYPFRCDLFCLSSLFSVLARSLLMAIYFFSVRSYLDSSVPTPTPIVSFGGGGGISGDLVGGGDNVGSFSEHASTSQTWRWLGVDNNKNEVANSSD
jgi:hypothetical protein